MDKKKSIIKKLKNFKNLVNQDYPVDRIIFFGSRTRNRAHRYSDIDLIIVSKKFKRMNFIIRGAKMYNYWKLNYPVDFLCYTPEEFKKLKEKTTIVKEAVIEGIMI